MQTRFIPPEAPAPARRRKRWDGSLQPAGAGNTVTLTSAAQPAVVAYGVQNTPPAITLTLASSAQPALVAYNANETFPPNTVTLASAAQPASVAYDAQNTPPSGLLTLASAAQPAVAAYDAEGVVGNLVTLASAAQPASITYGAQETPPPNTLTLGAAAQPASVAYAAAGAAPANTVTLAGAARPASVAYAALAPVTATGNGPWPHAMWANAMWPNAMWPGVAAGAVATYPDLLAAVVARLRDFDGGAFAAAVGETSGATKLWADEVLGGPGLPWVRVTEVGESSSPDSPQQDGLSHYVGRGMLQLDVFAAGKKQARDLRRMAVQALNDSPLAYADGAHLGLWLQNGTAPPSGEVGVGAAVTYHAVATFLYFVDRTY